MHSNNAALIEGHFLSGMLAITPKSARTILAYFFLSFQATVIANYSKQIGSCH